MSKKNAPIILILAVLISVIFINLISLQQFMRFDLTKNNKFTLSKASIDTMENLKDVMVVTAYFSEDIPMPYSGNARYVQDLLEEYRAKSDGKLSFEFIDPFYEETAADQVKKQAAQRDIFGHIQREPTSVEADLMKLGIEPVEIRVVEDDRQQIKRAYMGLVIRYMGKQEVISVVQEVYDLEKVMTLLMRRLTQKKLPVLAVYSQLPEEYFSQWIEAAKSSVELKIINSLNNHSDWQDANAILAIGIAEDTQAETLLKLSEFINTGKGVALLFDRYKVNRQTFASKEAGNEVKSGFIWEWLQQYGISVDNNLVADANCATLNLSEQRAGMMISIPVQYPFIPEVRDLSQTSPLTKGIAGILIPFTSSIQVSDVLGESKINILAKSGKNSWLEMGQIDTSPRRKWDNEEITPAGPFTLMVEVGNKKQKWRLVVAGTSAFLWDNFVNGPNEILALNLLDWLVAEEDLLQMRSRDSFDLPLNQNISNESKLFIKYGNILGAPLLLIAYGLLRWFFRQKKRRRLEINR